MLIPDIEMLNEITVSDSNAAPRLAVVLPLSSLKPKSRRQHSVPTGPDAAR